MNDNIGIQGLFFIILKYFLALEQAKLAALAHREQLQVCRGQTHSFMARWEKRYLTIEGDAAVLYFTNAGDIFPTNFLPLCNALSNTACL